MNCNVLAAKYKVAIGGKAISGFREQGYLTASPLVSYQEKDLRMKDWNVQQT